MKAFKVQLARRFADGLVFDRHLILAIDENLTVGRLGAQASRQVYHRPNCCVVEAPFKTDPPQRGVALRDAHTEPQIIVVLAPFAGQLAYAGTHLDGHADGAQRGIGARSWGVNPAHPAIPCEAVQGDVVLVNELAYSLVIFAQDTNNVFRLRGFRKAREATQLTADDGDLPAMALEYLFIRR